MKAEFHLLFNASQSILRSDPDEQEDNKTIGKLTGSRSLWTVKPMVKIVPSGKVYKRNKRIKEIENIIQNI